MAPDMIAARSRPGRGVNVRGTPGQECVVNELQSQPPVRLGEFAVTGRLATDDLREVYLAESADQARVAIEVLREEVSEDAKARRRFSDEITDAQQLGVSGFPTILAADADAERPWVATASPIGPSLSERVRRSGPLPESDALSVAADVATTLAAMHAVGMVHGQLDPTKVVLTETGWRIADLGVCGPFGQTRGPSDAAPDGDPASFRAPEQHSREWVGSPADVFSLGCLAFFAATGRSPFGTTEGDAVAAAVVGAEPDLSDLVDPRLRGRVTAPPAIAGAVAQAEEVTATPVATARGGLGGD